MTTVAGGVLPTPVSSYADAAPVYRLDGWPCVLPLPPREKWPPPKGFTGWTGVDTSGADIAELAEVPCYRGTTQTALRMPATVVGVDIDDYDNKRGGDTLAEAVRRWGPLPAGPWSSARDDDVSGIRFFRVPAGTLLAGGIAFPELSLDDGEEAGIEIVQLHHRYAVVWPSIHPDTGTPYTWRATAGPGLGPKPQECPDLPPAWVDGLRNDSARPGRLAATDVATEAFLAAHTTGNRPWSGPLAAFRSRHGGKRPNRHDSMRDSACWITREAAAGQYSAGDALTALWHEFWAAARTDGKRTETTARIEFRGAVRWAVGQLDGLSRDEIHARTADARRPRRNHGRKLPRSSASATTNENEDEVRDDQAKPAEATTDGAGQAEEGAGEGAGTATTPARRARVIWASEIEPEPVVWAWEVDGEGRIPAGSLSVAAGREGTGKSSFGIYQAAHITRGTLPGSFYGTPRNVLYVAVEDSWRFTLIPRLIAAGADLGRVGRFDVLIDDDTEVTLSLPHDNDLLKQEIADHQVTYVVIDPLMSVIGSAIDTHRERDVRTALDPLVRIARQTEAVLMGIAHFNKGSSSDAASLITGSGAFKNVPRSIFGFAKDPEAENGARVMSQVKNSLGRDDLPSLAYQMTGVEVQTRKGPARTARFDFIGESDRSVEDVLRDGGVSDPDEVAERNEVAEWLKGYLAEPNGSRPVVEVYKAGQAIGYSRDQLKRAKKKLGYTAVKPSMTDGWHWSSRDEGSGKGAKSAGNQKPTPFAPFVAPFVAGTPGATARTCTRCKHESDEPLIAGRCRSCAYPAGSGDRESA